MSLLKKILKNTFTSKNNMGIEAGDIFLVSYPRSGNTWLRFVLANLFYKDEDVNFTNIHEYCPEINKLNDFQSKGSTPRIIKSHEIYNPSFPKTIYIARDGRDVYVSYYYYLKNKLPEGMSFRDFLLKGSLPYGYWGDHVSCWLNESKNPLLLIKYEEMFLEPQKTIRMVLEFIKMNAEDEDITAALQKASFESMREKEDKLGRGKYKSGPDTFMRKGKVGDWKNHFGEEEKRIFKEKENQMLINLGYEKDPNW